MEAHDVHAALRRIDVIYKAVFALVVAVVVLHRDFNVDVVLRSLEVHDLGISRCFAAVEVGDELLDASVIVEGLFAWLMMLIVSLVPQCDAKRLCEECHLAKTLLEDIIIVFACLLENLRIREESNCCSIVFLVTFSDNMHRFCDLAA